MSSMVITIHDQSGMKFPLSLFMLEA